MLKFEDLIVGITEARITTNLRYFGIISSIDTEERHFIVHWKLDYELDHHTSYTESVLTSTYFKFSNPNSIKAFLLNGTPVDLNKVFP